VAKEERKDGEPATPERAGPEGDESSKASTEERRLVRCVKCGHALTDAKARMEKDGTHRHDFVNPAGVAFRIGCFRDAPGCVAVGEGETFWSWFSGYAWRHALCGSCAAHVGWSYRASSAESDGFYGLIVDRIVE
jgi:hypothetical protein